MLKNFLKLLVEKNGTNLYLSPGSLPSLKLNGELVQIGKRILTAEDTRELALKLLDRNMADALDSKPEIDLAIEEPRVGRFGVNIFQQRSNVSLIFRRVKTDIPQCSALGIPETIQQLAVANQGLLLVAGSRITAKNTTLASLLDHRNRTRSGHILTLENPIEYVHKHRQCIVNQREIGTDTASIEQGLEHVFRQAPDVVLIGEINSREAMRGALLTAQSGALCIAVLHCDSAVEALDKIFNMYPQQDSHQLFMELLLQTNAMLVQRMAPTAKFENAQSLDLLPASAVTKDLIRAGKSNEIEQTLKSSSSETRNFDSLLYEVYQAHVSGRSTSELAAVEKDAQAAATKMNASTTETPDGNVLGWQVAPLEEEAQQAG